MWNMVKKRVFLWFISSYKHQSRRPVDTLYMWTRLLGLWCDVIFESFRIELSQRVVCCRRATLNMLRVCCERGDESWSLEWEIDITLLWWIIELSCSAIYRFERFFFGRPENGLAHSTAIQMLIDHDLSTFISLLIKVQLAEKKLFKAFFRCSCGSHHRDIHLFS